MKLHSALTLALGLVVSAVIGSWTALVITGHYAASHTVVGNGILIAVVLAFCAFVTWVIEAGG